MSQCKPRIAVILAAGKGTRMRSELPKPLFPVAGRTMLDWVLGAARQGGCERILIIVGHGADRLRSEVVAEDVDWVIQEPQLGTGHALAQAEAAIDGDATVVVLSGDVPMVTGETIDQLATAAERSWGAMAVAELEQPGSLGRVIARGQHLDRIVEAADASPEELAVRLINAGIYALPAPVIFDELRRLDCDNAKGEYYLTDALGQAVRDGQTIELHHLDDPREAFGVNDRRDLAKVDRALLDRHLDHLMLEGVTILDPRSTRIEPGVRIGLDTVIHPGVSLFGHTRIGKTCEIHQGCWIRDSELADDVTIYPYSVLENAQVADQCSAGPFARLRPASVLLKGSHVGNFVELKKTTLGERSKASHLTYLGDAEIGPDSNIGAGVVTCNYDGVSKHRTEVGKGAFVGSDTMLIAPIKVGDGATTGAGSTITQDVPAGALAVGRAKQLNVPEWAKKKRRKAPGS